MIIIFIFDGGPLLKLMQPQNRSDLNRKVHLEVCMAVVCLGGDKSFWQGERNWILVHR